jgi:hypothetical protein
MPGVLLNEAEIDQYVNVVILFHGHYPKESMRFVCLQQKVPLPKQHKCHKISRHNEIGIINSLIQFAFQSICLRNIIDS